MSTKKPAAIYLKDYQPTPYLIDSVFLHFDLHEDHTTVKAVLSMRRNPKVTTPNAPLQLHGDELQLQSVRIDGDVLSEDQYQVDEQFLTIEKVPEKFTLETEVIIHPEKNTQLSGLYKSGSNFCTQCEAEGFRRITYYYDRPDVMATFNVTITADKGTYPYLLSNGNLIEKRDLDNNRQWVHWQDPSLKPCYLFALVAGDFDLITDSYTTMSGKSVQLDLYLEKGYADQGDFAMQSLKRAMQWDEQTYGREYDLDIYMTVAVSDFNMGAMENKGLNVFNTKYILAKQQTATDNDYIGIEGVVGHEYFHNWTGNRVTCRDWFQLTLKEGLTVFRDQTFTEDMTSAAVARLDTIDFIRNEQFVEDAGPMAHPIRPSSYMEINNFYTKTVYRKGAEVIRMVRTLIGKDNFRKGMDLYFHRHDGQAVTTDDFIQAMADASGRDFTQFKNWYSQAGTPILDVQGEYNQQQQTYQLTIKQSCPATPESSSKQPFHIPIAVGLVGPSCSDMSVQLDDEQHESTTKILELTESEQTFTFNNVSEKPVPSLLRGFSAPVKLQYPYTAEELAWLWQCDSDFFVRWDAGQQLCLLVIKDMLAQQDKDSQLVSLFVETVGTILQDSFDDLRYQSHLLTMPNVNYILTNLNGADVASIFAAREQLKRHISQAYEGELHTHYVNNHQAQYEYNQTAVGQRSLKNVCLAYLQSLEKQAHRDLAFQQYQNATNMSDAIGALVAFNDVQSKERDQALESFYQQWKHEPLVVNKWLSLHAMSHLPNTLDTVKGLLTHAAFNIKNPNNVYALVCGFGRNTLRFHESDGSGYKFVADQVIKVDQFNGQVAARVMQPLISREFVDGQRATLMNEQLQRIANVDNLSSDIYELVTKSMD